MLTTVTPSEMHAASSHPETNHWHCPQCHNQVTVARDLAVPVTAAARNVCNKPVRAGTYAWYEADPDWHIAVMQMADVDLRSLVKPSSDRIIHRQCWTNELLPGQVFYYDTQIRSMMPVHGNSVLGATAVDGMAHVVALKR
ncbi:hypothetical protein HJC99_06500 [Candidatus Saccharibacteria bacterium]|nr:hypothetical protein [Candidatus Saccharibacteria bacterium]